MKIRNLMSALLLSAALLNGAAQATILVDTGSPVLTQNGAIAVINYPYAHQSVGAGFSLAGSNSITDIESYFYVSNPGTLTLALYSQIAGLPGNELYSKEFSISGVSGSKGWYGISGVDWAVSAGNYWVTYEIRNSQTYNGALEFAAPFPLEMAVKNDYYTNWFSHGRNSFGLVVEGYSIPNPVTVPEPGILALFGLALGGLASTRRKKVSSN